MDVAAALQRYWESRARCKLPWWTSWLTRLVSTRRSCFPCRGRWTIWWRIASAPTREYRPVRGGRLVPCRQIRIFLRFGSGGCSWHRRGGRPPENLRRNFSASTEAGSGGRFGFTDIPVEQSATALGAGLHARYEILRELPGGGMGRIYLAQERISGRFVVLKTLKEGWRESREMIQQFIREAAITARLQHAHVIPVYDLGFWGADELYYTMRYINGGLTLADVLQGLSLVERLYLLRDAASAVAYAHKQGLWHRDVKPENILVGERGDAYVIDWGLVSVQPGKSYSLEIPEVLRREHRLRLPEDLMLKRTEYAYTTNGGLRCGTACTGWPRSRWREWKSHDGAVLRCLGIRPDVAPCSYGKTPFRPRWGV